MTNLNPESVAQAVIEETDGDFREIAEIIKNLTDYLADALD